MVSSPDRVIQIVYTPRQGSPQAQETCGSSGSARTGDFGLSGRGGWASLRHRSEIRSHLGFRECSVADADNLTDWFAAIPALLDAATTGRLLALLGWGEDTEGEETEDEPEDPESVLALTKS